MRSRSDLAGRLGGDIALRRRSDIAKRNHLGREGGRGDVAATFVKVAAMSLRLSCDLNFLLDFNNNFTQDPAHVGTNGYTTVIGCNALTTFLEDAGDFSMAPGLGYSKGRPYQGHQHEQASDQFLAVVVLQPFSF